MKATEEINITEVMIGCQGSGKSWYAMDRAAKIADEYDCPLVIHDSGSASIRKADNPYNKSDWKLVTQSFHDKKGKLSGAVIRISNTAPITVVNTAYAEDALYYADAIRNGKDVVVLIDEVAAAQSITPSYIGEPFRTRIAMRRAMRTALLFCMQYPTMANRFLTGTATSLKVFRLEHEKDLKALEDMRFSDAQIETVSKLPRGEFIEHMQGFGTK